MQEDKYISFDKKMTDTVKKELKELGITKYPTVCHYCKGTGCKHCNQKGKIVYEVD